MQSEKIEEIDVTAPEWKELYEFERNRELLPPTPNNPPWNSWIAVGILIVSIAAIFIFPLLFLAPYIGIVMANGTGSIENLKNDTTAILLNLIAVLPAHIFTLVVAWFVVTKNKKYDFREMVGWSQGNFRWYYYILIVIGFFVVAAIVSQFLPEQENELTKILASSYTATLLVAFLATFTAPMVEEVVYRGVLYSAFQRSIGVPGAVFLVTLLFALVHVPQYWGSPGTILLICLLSLVLTLVRVKTDNLLPCVILHTIFNGLQSLVLVLEPYLPKDLTTTEQKAAAVFHIFK